MTIKKPYDHLIGRARKIAREKHEAAVRVTEVAALRSRVAELETALLVLIERTEQDFEDRAVFDAARALLAPAKAVGETSQ